MLGAKKSKILPSFFSLFRKKKDSNATAIVESLVRTKKHGVITWIDIERPTRAAFADLADKYHFLPSHVRLAVSGGLLDQVDVEERYTFVLLRIPRYNSEKSISIDQVCFFIGKNYVISVHSNAKGAVATLFSEADEDESKKTAIFKKSSSYVLAKILQAILKETRSIVGLLQEEVEVIEDLVFEVTISGVYEISALRQKIIRMRRVVSSFKGVITELSNTQLDVTKQLAELIKESGDLRETIDEAKDTVEVFKDADFTVSTERTNKILGTLTVIFTLSLPATVVGSFYGMNVYVPGGIESGAWTFLGQFSTFYTAIALATIPAGLMYILFKYKKWF